MTDRTPTGDLRERLAEALYRRLREQVGSDAGSQIRAEAKADDLVDAVLPVVEAETARVEAEIDDHIIKPERILHEQTIERAEEAERKRDQAREAIADERRGRLAAEAAVRRCREALARFDGRGVSTPEGTDWNIPTAGEVLDAWRTSLDAEGRQDEALTALERQRDQAIAALTRHAAEAHRRKWAHSEDNQAAFDALHRLGDEILASRDRLRAALDAETKETP